MDERGRQVLGFLREHGPATMQEIADALALSPTGTGHWVRRLVRSGELIRQSPQPPSRAYRYALP